MLMLIDNGSNLKIIVWVKVLISAVEKNISILVRKGSM
jgi:hypothetical protein